MNVDICRAEFKIYVNRIMSVDQMFKDKIAIDNMSFDEMILDKMFLRQN